MLTLILTIALYLITSSIVRSSLVIDSRSYTGKTRSHRVHLSKALRPAKIARIASMLDSLPTLN